MFVFFAEREDEAELGMVEAQGGGREREEWDKFNHKVCIWVWDLFGCV